MELRLLGPVHARSGSDVVSLGPRQQRLVLAVLALEVNRAVPIDRLVSWVWPDDPPRSAAHAVRVYVHNLRSIVTSAGAADELMIDTEGSSYVLRADPDRVDAHRFLDAVARARAAADDRARVALLDEALGRWTGPALADTAPPDIRQRLCGGLEESRLVAAEDRFDALLRLGVHLQVVGEITSLADAHPTRERLVGQLMLALHRSGQTSKALDLARRTRALLADELGIDPGTELQELILAILRNDPALTSEHAPRAFTSPPPVPAPRTRLIGRDDQVAGIADQLTTTGTRLVTLTGPGGVGKTRLALEVAQRPWTGLGGVAFVSLASVREPAHVLAAIADGIGVHDAVGHPMIDTLRNYLRDRGLLLVVDNCEHVLAAGPDLADLLDAVPRLVVLATSRAPLRIRGEHVRPVEPLTDEAAAELFVERTTQAGAAADLDPSVVRTICQHLDRLPLAIELAAARTRVLPTALLAAQLDRTEARLDLPGPRDLPDRQRTLRATIAWSYELLSADEQALLRAVAVFAGGWTLDAAAAVTGLDPARTLDLHAGLMDVSLIHRTGHADEARFDLLETVRAFALTEAEATDTADDHRARHCGYVETLVDRAGTEMEGPHQAIWFARLTQERDNLWLAMRWLLDRGDIDRFAGICRQWQFSTMLGHTSERARWTSEALNLGAPMSDTARARLLSLCAFASFGPRPDAAVRMADEAVRLGRRQDDLATRQFALSIRGQIALWLEDLDRVDAMFGEAATIGLERGAVCATARDRVGRTAALILRGRYTEADQELAEIEAQMRAQGGPWEVGLVLSFRGKIMLDRGEWTRATPMLVESMDLLASIGDIYLLMYVVQRLAIVLAYSDNARRCAVLFGASTALADQFGLAQLGVHARDGEHAEEKVLVELGQERYDELFAEGRRMPLHELLALVRRPRSESDH
ncbi:MAG TPA: BTAD domain-containing putative transcriptional regulator [Pseudonocardiaceae bacterium]